MYKKVCNCSTSRACVFATKERESRVKIPTFKVNGGIFSYWRFVLPFTYNPRLISLGLYWVGRGTGIKNKFSFSIAKKLLFDNINKIDYSYRVIRWASLTAFLVIQFNTQKSLTWCYPLELELRNEFIAPHLSVKQH